MRLNICEAHTFSLISECAAWFELYSNLRSQFTKVTLTRISLCSKPEQCSNNISKYTRVCVHMLQKCCVGWVWQLNNRYLKKNIDITVFLFFFIEFWFETKWKWARHTKNLSNKLRILFYLKQNKRLNWRKTLILACFSTNLCQGQGRCWCEKTGDICDIRRWHGQRENEVPFL